MIILAFLAGGLFGMMGMAVLAYGSKTSLLRENSVMRQRLQFLESDKRESKQYQNVKDPKPQVHSLIN
ncbi:hypothetical protein JW906_08230 [bacterium]|nr:hypothetical protein [bacterium]